MKSCKKASIITWQLKLLECKMLLNIRFLEELYMAEVDNLLYLAVKIPSTRCVRHICLFKIPADKAYD